MKFNTSFAFIKLSFAKIILTLYDVANIRLLRILRKTLPRPAQKLCLEHFWRHQLKQITLSYSGCITDCKHDFEKEKHLENTFI